MRPSHVCEALHHLVRIRQPVFLWGPPGVGKSRLVADVARRQGRKLYDLRAVLLDPVDLRGLPRISDEGITSWCVPEFLPHPQDTEEGILFLDELNAAPPLVQAACYQLILDRRVGQYRLPDGWAVVAAGNRESDRAVTYRMPSALANRMPCSAIQSASSNAAIPLSTVTISETPCAFSVSSAFRFIPYPSDRSGI